MKISEKEKQYMLWQWINATRGKTVIIKHPKPLTKQH